MIFQLKLKNKNGTERIVPLPDGDHLIGRSRNATIHVSEDDVSGKHLISVRENPLSRNNRARAGLARGIPRWKLPTPIRPGR